ncbi:MAG: MFS transporter [Spirochaetales bacterium]|nr:MAG: MFS transporter [Spirochaetales bacterium]
MQGIKSRPALTSFSFLSMFFLGVGTAVLGAASRNIGLSPFQIGLLISVQNLGFILSVAAAGALADSVQKPVILAAGSLILAAAFFFFYYRSSYALNLLIMFFIGVGIGTYEGAADAMLLDLYDRRQGLFITVNHFFVTFGSLMISLYLIFLQMNWRGSMIQSAAAVGVLSVLFFFSRTVKQAGPAQADRAFSGQAGGGSGAVAQRIAAVFRKKGAVTLFLGAVGAVSLEIGTLGLLTTYLMDLRGFGQVTSKIVLIVYLIGVACGRLLLGSLLKKEKLPAAVTVLFGCGAALTALLYFVPAVSWFYYAAAFCLGMSVSVLLPSIITLTGLSYPEEAGTAMGLIKIGIPIGSILFPFLLSMISRYAGFRVSFLLFPAVSLGCFLIFLLNAGSIRTKIS